MPDDFIIKHNSGEASLVIGYAGVCNHSVLEKFTEVLFREAEPYLSPKEIKTTLFCSNEVIQNVGLYSMERGSESDASGIGKFELAILPSRVLITSTNLTTVSDYERMKERIENLNALDQEGLKQLYKEKLRSESEEESKGAGIGLIEIRRKSKNPIVITLSEQESAKQIIFEITIDKGNDNG